MRPGFIGSRPDTLSSPPKSETRLKRNWASRRTPLSLWARSPAVPFFKFFPHPAAAVWAVTIQPRCHERSLHALRRTAQCDSIPPSLQRRELLAPPIEMLLRSCPERLYLLLVISVTGVISVGVDNLEPVLHQAEEFVERFHQRVMLLFARSEER